jgi:hypothetical protein
VVVFLNDDLLVNLCDFSNDFFICIDNEELLDLRKSFDVRFYFFPQFLDDKVIKHLSVSGIRDIFFNGKPFDGLVNGKEVFFLYFLSDFHVNDWVLMFFCIFLFN